MSDRLIARRYAKALLEIGVKQGSLDTLRAELASVDALVKGHPDLERLCMHPLVAPSRKAETFDLVLLQAGVSPTLRSFFKVLAQAARLALVHQVVVAFGELVDQRMGIQEALVESVQPLSSAQEQALTLALSRRTGSSIRLRWSQVPALLGGLRVQVGSTVYDASLAGRLQQLKARMLSA